MASGNPFSASLAAEHLDLVSLIQVSEADGSLVYPSEDTIAALLHARARAEHPYTRVSASGTEYIVLNPLRALHCLNDDSRKGYQDDVDRTDGGIGGQPRQPSVYELAGRVWLLMSRQRECQTVVFHGLTGSGKTTTSRHLVNQILELATTSKAQRRLAVQVNHMVNLLESFGNAKSALNPSASQHGRYLELHFAFDGTISGAKVLPFGLNKTRVNLLQQDERSFHVFYQMLAGATPEEREELGLEDMDTYRLLSSSGCFYLPAGPFSDDSTQLGELRASFAALGFKPKHVRSIFAVLTSILILSNLSFTDTRAEGSLGMTSYEEQTSIIEREELAVAAHLLGVTPEHLEAVLVNRTKWVSHDLASVFLDAATAETQRDSLMRDLYSILFAFVVEMANKRLAPDVDATPTIQIGILDVPGHQSRTLTAEPYAGRRSLLNTLPLISVSGQNQFNEFGINFSSEIVHSYLLRRTFEDELSWNAQLRMDGINIPEVLTMDNIGCLDLLRGGALGSRKLAKRPRGVIGMLAEVGEHIKGEDRDDVKASVVVSHLQAFDKNPSYIARPAAGLGPSAREGRMFGISHWAGQVSYDATDFIDRNADVLDKQLVELLRNSADPFITKLVSGPALSTECHPLDDNIVVEAQVSSAPLRPPTAIANRILGSEVQDSVEYPIDTSVPQLVTAQLNATLATVFDTIDRTRVWGVHCIRPNDSGHANSYDRRRIKAQVNSLLLPDLVKRREIDYVAEYPLHQFCVRHAMPVHDTHRAVEEFALTHGWNAGPDYAIGNERIWLAYGAWREQEDLLRSTETRRGSGEETLTDEDNAYAIGAGAPRQYLRAGPGEDMHPSESMDNLLGARASDRDLGRYADGGAGGYGYDSPDPDASDVWATKDEPYDPDAPLPASKEMPPVNGLVTKEKRHHTTEVVATSTARRWWIRITWLFTWWIPSFLLKKLGGMKRPDVRMAWREKVTICMMIALMCGIVIFWIIGFGKVLCPENDKAWNQSQLQGFQADPTYYVAIAGSVYDFTNWWKAEHSDIPGVTTPNAIMQQFSGQDMTYYFPPPMYQACSGLVSDQSLYVETYGNWFQPIITDAIHYSGTQLRGIQRGQNTTKLADDNWYYDQFLPFLKQYYKGFFVWDKSTIAEQGSGDVARPWAIYKGKVYDLSGYFETAARYTSSSGPDLPNYSYLATEVSSLFQASSGQDITSQLDKALAGMSADNARDHLHCLNQAFYLGDTDFRKTPRCLVQNYMLLAFAIILMITVVAKFLAALQLGGKRNPEQMDKFVICQVPCYTEGEESLKKTIDSLATLQYDDKRKLIFIICDGNIIGSGNNRPTPRIVLDILGVDPKLDPEPLIFKSIGEGSKQLNYGKIYSGLYEYEGHVVPYVVVVKVGKPSETSRPGNRGKRDSQVLLMQYLNRVHFDAPMCPLELEIYHQMRNVIGIDPTFYEYIFQVDADTTVTPESLNRLISCTADDSKIIGICGETKLANERESFTTMIQVYEYYISHHLTKAFESLFGSVTCLPGCFSVYRIRTADKGRPIIISSVVIDEYAEPNVDTLHKKNLFSLGEDRYLTTLMMKHFPTYKMKFTPDAIAHTVAPSRWNVLLSQRRRWINSTIHNLAELMFLPEMCGFCLFSMRFIVFIDLLGTIILPATFAYLIYLIVTVSTGKAPIPILSIAMIAAVYGLQAVIFILKREFMLIGWMFVYILAYPVYSVFLPIYSFWSMDDFSWGNTRQVVGEGNNKMVVIDDTEPFDDSMIPLRTFKEYEANAWENTSLPSDGEQDGVSQYARTERSRRKRLVERSMLSSAQGSDNGGNGSIYSGSRVPSPNPFMGIGDQRMTMFSQPAYNLGYGNPFDSPAMSDAASLRPPTMFAPYASPMGSPAFPMNPMQTRGSSYSLATTANPFSNTPSIPVNTDPSPTDGTILSTLRTYLNSQDLMTVTKRSAREAIYGLFPNANLQDRAAWLNENIDKILSEV